MVGNGLHNQESDKHVVTSLPEQHAVIASWQVAIQNISTAKCIIFSVSIS